MIQQTLDGQVARPVRQHPPVIRTWRCSDAAANLVDQLRLVYDLPKSAAVSSILDAALEIVRRMSPADRKAAADAAAAHDLPKLIEIVARNVKVFKD